MCVCVCVCVFICACVPCLLVFILVLFHSPELKATEKEVEVVLKFPEAEALSPPILQINDVSFGYSSDRMIFSNVNLGATLESRICIVSSAFFSPPSLWIIGNYRVIFLFSSHWINKTGHFILILPLILLQCSSQISEITSYLLLQSLAFFILHSLQILSRFCKFYSV